MSHSSPSLYATMVAITPNGFTSHTSLMFIALSMRCRHSSFSTMMLAICSPAMLNALLGATQVTECFWNSSDTEANGV